MTAIFEKELSSYFHNPLGYLYLAVYYLFGGQFFLMQVRYTGTNDTSGIFSNFYLIVLFTLPLLTMRLLAEEKRQRTDQALFTAPVSLGEIVLGKFLAAFSLFASGIAVCIVYYIVLSSLSRPSFLLFIGNFLGLLLLGGAMISMGIFVSSMTESQGISAIGTFGCVIAVLLLDSVGQMLPSGLAFLKKPLDALSFSRRYYDFTSGILDPANVVFFISVAAVFLFLTVCMLDKKRQVSSRRLQNLSSAAVAAILFIAAAVLFNVVFSLILERVPSLDLTENRIYRLSEDSITSVQDISEPVAITVCYDETSLRSTEYGLQMDELLKDYERQNRGISVRFADILREPQIVSEYSEYGVAEGSIIIESSRRTRVTALNRCVETTAAASGYGYAYSSRAEQVLTSGILYVTENDPVQVSILTGHSEVGCEDILGYLADNNYEIMEQNISTEDPDPESRMLFLFAPTTDYTPEELEKLDSYLDNGGSFGRKLIYVASYSQPKLPNLEGFLSEWGIGIGRSVILETDSSNAYDQRGFMFGADFTDDAEEYLDRVKNPSLPFLGYYCRPLTLRFENMDNRTAKALVATKDSCVLYPLDQGETDEADENPAARVIMAVGERLKYIGAEEHTSQLAVFASTAMFSSNSTVGNSFNNQDFTVEFLNALAGKQNGISIPSVSFSSEKLNITQFQYRTALILLGILLPLAVFAAGTAMWVHRRRL